MSSFDLDSSENLTVQRLMRSISTNTQKLDQNSKRIEGMLQQYGTPRDSVRHREETLALIKTTAQLGKDIFKDLKELNEHSSFINKDRQLKLQKDRLTDTYTKCLKFFSDNEKLALNKPTFTEQTRNDTRLIDFENRQVANYDVSYKNDFNEQQQKQQQEQIEIERLRAVEEQSKAMRDLEQNITDVNSIFKDLAILVHDQGEIIDSIEVNIEQTQSNVKSATTELKQAVTYQSKARQKKFILVLIALFILGIIALIIYLSVPKKK